MKNFELKSSLELLKQHGLYRSRKIIDSPQGVRIKLDGRALINFCSNDYLGLANHPQVIQAFKKGVDQYGVGSGSAHLICGHSTAHHVLETQIAAFTGRDRALLFSTGYMANMGVITALMTKKDAIFEDKLNHASLIDAGLLSGATFQRYLHQNVEQLPLKLQRSEAAKKMIITDGVFSMDGDFAPFVELIKIAQQNEAALMVDDAHGFGVLGKTGAGVVEQFALTQADVPILMGTFGKAFGTAGAFVAGSDDLIETLIQKARTYIYTTAMPAAIAKATSASLTLIMNEPERREKLQGLIKQFQDGAKSIGLTLMPSETPIQPILMGDTQKVLAISQKLLEQGFLVTAIRPPTVPKNKARLRVTLSANHSEKEVDGLLKALRKVTFIK